jgi:hypothetical protein
LRYDPNLETAFPQRPLSRLPSPQGHHVIRRVQDAPDLRRQGLECFALLPTELVPVADPRTPPITCPRTVPASSGTSSPALQAFAGGKVQPRRPADP